MRREAELCSPDGTRRLRAGSGHLATAVRLPHPTCFDHCSKPIRGFLAVPKVAIHWSGRGRLFDDLIGAGEKRPWHGQAQRLGGL